MAYQDETLNQMVEAIKKALQPKKIYLFGSRARGDHTVDSDYDIVLVVSNEHTDKGKRRDLVYDALKPFKVPVDFFVYTETEFDNWKNELSSIPETAIYEGQELDLG